MKLATLFSRRSDGKVQSWTVEIDGEMFRTSSGIWGAGSDVVSDWTQCVGKQKRSHTEQALKEAKALHKKKLDEGYCEQIADIDKPKFFSPMLAHVYEDHADLLGKAFAAGERVFIQPKLDGMRCIAQREGLTSRNGKPINSAPHVHDAIRKRFTSDLTFVVDGELYAHKLSSNFEKVISLAKKSQPTLEDLMESAEILQYHVYDLPKVADAKGDIIAPCLATFAERLNQMRFLFSAANLPIVLVETIEVKHLSEVAEHFARWRAEGYEGAMIRLNRGYEQKRSKNLLKFKEFMDAEFEILSVNEGVGNRSGMAGSLTLKMPDGRTFDSGIRGNTDFFKRILAERNLSCSLVGRQATITFQNYTSEGKPRFPIFLRVRESE